MRYPNSQLPPLPGGARGYDRNQAPMMQTTELPPVPPPAPGISSGSGTSIGPGTARATNIAPLPPAATTAMAPATGSTAAGGVMQTVGTTGADLNLTPNSGNGTPVIAPPNGAFAPHFPNIDFSGMPNPQDFQGDWHSFISAFRQWGEGQRGAMADVRAERKDFRDSLRAEAQDGRFNPRGIGGVIARPGFLNFNGG